LPLVNSEKLYQNVEENVSRPRSRMTRDRTVVDTVYQWVWTGQVAALSSRQHQVRWSSTSSADNLSPFYH